MKLLIVEDDALVRATLVAMVQFHWLDAEVLVAGNSEEALPLFRAHAPDLVLLDIGLPGASGYEVLAEIRRSSEVPIVVLTGRASEVDQARALELGADMHVSKPFSPLALLARLEALLRRTQAEPAARAVPDLVAGSVAIDLRAERVWVGSREVALTRAEYALLAALADARGRVLTQDALFERVWGAGAVVIGTQLKVLVSRLRGKLGHDASAGGQIETVRGVGYSLALTGTPRAEPPPDRAVRAGDGGSARAAGAGRSGLQVTRN
jgi:two-component system KDP operon response regulator KdpE